MPARRIAESDCARKESIVVCKQIAKESSCPQAQQEMACRNTRQSKCNNVRTEKAKQYLSIIDYISVPK